MLLLDMEGGDSGVDLSPKDVENNGLISPSSLHLFCVSLGRAAWPRWCLIGCPLPVDQFGSKQLCWWLLVGYQAAATNPNRESSTG